MNIHRVFGEDIFFIPKNVTLSRTHKRGKKWTHLPMRKLKI